MKPWAPERPGRGLDVVLGGAGTAEADVVGDGAGEEVVLLGDHHRGPVEVGRGERAQVDAVERDRAVDRVVEAGGELGDRGLAGAGGADQGHGLPGRDGEVEAGQHRHALDVLEPDAVEVEVAAGVGERHRVGRLGDAGLLLEDAGDLLQGRVGGLERVVELRDVHHRLEELPQVEQERRQHADGDLAVEGEVAAVDQDDGDRDVADQPDLGHEPGDQAEGDEVGRAVLVVDVVEDLLVAGLAAEGLDGADAVHRLDEVDDHQRDLLAGHPVALRRLLAEPVGRPGQERDRRAAPPGPASRRGRAAGRRCRTG